MTKPTAKKRAAQKRAVRCNVNAAKRAESRGDAKSLAHERMKLWRKSPLAFVRDNFKVEPDAWQLDVLTILPTKPKIAMSACKGPGKSAVLAWCGWWLLACHKDSKGIATSITGDNLRDNLWTELAVWYAVCSWLQAEFTLNAERIASRERPKTWWLSARSFPQDADRTQQANTLAGLHNAKGVVFVLLDEVGDYPEGVVVAAEGIFANEHLSAAWLLAAGNPTQTDGPLHRITYNDPTYYVARITGDPDDPKRSPRISLKWAQEHIDKWGRDNAWVRVNILGLEPLVGSTRLLGVVEVEAAQRRDVPALTYTTDPIIWGVDPARYGDDEACLARRQGVLVRKLITWRGLDGPQLATEIAKELIEAEKNGQLPDAIFIDQGGVGASCYDHLRLLGWDDRIIGVDFGGVPGDRRFADKSSEMWWDASQWVKSKPSCLPNDPELRAQLTTRDIEYKMINKRAVLKVRSKEQMRADGLPSPDKADAFVLTFHSPVAKLQTPDEAGVHDRYRRSNKCATEYEQYSR